LNRLTTPTISK